MHCDGVEPNYRKRHVMSRDQPNQKPNRNAPLDICRKAKKYKKRCIYLSVVIVCDVLLKYTTPPFFHATSSSASPASPFSCTTTCLQTVCPTSVRIHARSLSSYMLQPSLPSIPTSIRKPRKELVLTRCTQHRLITPLGTKAANQQKTDKDLDNGEIRLAIYAWETLKKSRGDDSRRWIDTCF